MNNKEINKLKQAINNNTLIPLEDTINNVENLYGIDTQFGILNSIAYVPNETYLLFCFENIGSEPIWYYVLLNDIDMRDDDPDDDYEYTNHDYKRLRRSMYDSLYGTVLSLNQLKTTVFSSKHVFLNFLNCALNKIPLVFEKNDKFKRILQFNEVGAIQF